MRKPRVTNTHEAAAPAEPPRWLRPAALTLLSLLLLGIFATEMSDPDAWWHLKTGEYLLAHHRLPDPDPFAWTTASAPPASPGEAVTRSFNLKHEWLAQVWMYLLYAAGGFAAVVAWKAVALSAVCGLAGWTAARRAGYWLWGVTAAMAAVPVVGVFRSDRPALFTFLFVAVFVAVFESRRRLWLLPVLSVVWANCHGGFFLGWVVCAAYSAGALRGTDRDEARRIWISSAAAVLASALNPNGFRVVETLLLYRQSALTVALIEWTRPYLWGPPYAFDLLLYAGALALLISWRRVRLSDWLLYALFAAAALMAVRNIVLIGIVAPVVIAAYLPAHLPRLRRFALPAHYAVLAVLAGWLAWSAWHGAAFQFRAAEWRYPAGAARFLTANRIDAPLFNTYEYGGYLLFSGRKVFIDGRALSETVFQDYRKILGTPPGDPERARVLAQYGIRAIAINGFEYVSGVLYPLAVELVRMPDWQLVYEDAQAMVLLKDPPAGMPVIEKSRILDHLDTECRLHIERDPEYPLCARSLGDYYLRIGNAERARKALGLYLASDPDADAAARQAYQRLVQIGPR